MRTNSAIFVNGHRLQTRTTGYCRFEAAGNHIVTGQRTRQIRTDGSDHHPKQELCTVKRRRARAVFLLFSALSQRANIFFQEHLTHSRNAQCVFSVRYAFETTKLVTQRIQCACFNHAVVSEGSTISASNSFWVETDHHQRCAACHENVRSL